MGAHSMLHDLETNHGLLNKTVVKKVFFLLQAALKLHSFYHFDVASYYNITMKQEWKRLTEYSRLSGSIRKPQGGNQYILKWNYYTRTLFLHATLLETIVTLSSGNRNSFLKMKRPGHDVQGVYTHFEPCLEAYLNN
jgi:hypothetical protein